jgi:mRNA interferase YafQ
LSRHPPSSCRRCTPGRLDALCSRGPLAPELNDHPLKGEWKGWRDCHVAPDWVIIYRKTADELILARTGTHADLFE